MGKRRKGQCVFKGIRESDARMEKMIISPVSQSNLPILPGVPTAAPTLVRFRYLTCSSSLKCFAKSFPTSPPLSPLNFLSLRTRVTSTTRSAAPVTNKTVGAPLDLDFWESRVRRDGSTLVMKSTSWSRVRGPVHFVVSAIDSSI